MGRLIIVSNRLPVRPYVDDNGELCFDRSVGGLATGLSSVYEAHDALWMGAVESVAVDPRTLERRLLEEHSCVPVEIDPDQYDDYYTGFSNSTIWPLYHQFPQYVKFDERWWQAYQAVNETFADAVAAQAGPTDLIWVHDYHLQLLPAMLRERIPEATIGFFLHIPFPSTELFRMLPWRNDVLDGLLASDLVGFHTFDYVRHFLASVMRLRGRDNSFGRIDVDGREVRAEAFPMGIDVRRFEEAAASQEVRDAAQDVRAEFVGDKLILSIDRLDYTKGILERIRAYDEFLTKHPEWKGRATLALVAVPSRTDVARYQWLERDLDELVGHVNGRHGSIEWTPVRYMVRPLEFTELVAYYRVADVMLATPLRDGMNLIAKEYVAVKGDTGHGVLVLSEFAGVARELGEALIINPFDTTGFVEALGLALEMPLEQQRERLDAMLERLRCYTAADWAKDYLGSLKEAAEVRRSLQSVRMTANEAAEMEERGRSAAHRLFLLDYDGTLVPLVRRYEAAGPDQAVLDLLRDVASDPDTDLVIISGRTRRDLVRWLGDLPVTLAAEHGAFIRRPGEDWACNGDCDDKWKNAIRPIIELYVGRTPGARLEEKETCLVWHYRETDPELGVIRTRELRHVLEPLVANEGLALVEGNRVLEARITGVDKGKLTTTLIESNHYDFVFAAGDDRTDEDMFAALPQDAWSFCVHKHESRARYSVNSVNELRGLLARLKR